MSDGQNFNDRYDVGPTYQNMPHHYVIFSGSLLRIHPGSMSYSNRESTYFPEVLETESSHFC